MLTTDFGANIDRNYYPYKTGQSHLLSDKNDPILNRWKPKNFEVLLENIKHSGHPNSVDIIFHLMDFSGDAQENIVTSMIEYKRKAISEKGRKSLATYSAPDFGISYVITETSNSDELETVSEVYAVLRKYKSKCNRWLGLGSYTKSPNLVDFILYLDEPWKFDTTVEAECKDFFGLNNPGHRIILGNPQKVGRNEPCPCKSGLKYKKCCGLN